jgi:DNA repair protein RadC
MTKNSVGEFFVNYFKNSKEHRTAALLLDSNMRVLGLIEPYALDFGSGAVQGRPFIDAAVAAHATSVIIAHNHPYGPLFPSVSDRVGNSSVLKDLAVAGITLAEHYIISGEQYVCMMNTDSRLKLSDGDPHIKPTSDAAWWTDEKKSVLCDVLSVVFEEEEARRHTAEISSRFARLCDVFSADFYVLKDIVGQELAAIFLKLFFCIYIRQKTDRFVFGRAHTEEETVEYFRNLIALEPTEKVYIMLYDSRLRPKFCEFVSEGTVDSSNLPPRRLLEIAKRHEAAAVAIAHNHPRSGVAPSADDIGATETIKSLFETVGIRFLAHYVVSIDEYCVISEDGVKYKR